MSTSGQYSRTKVTFSGKAKDYVKYRIQLRAGLGLEGVAETLDERFDTRLPNTEAEILDENNNNDKDKILAKEMNNKAMNLIVMGQLISTMINAIELTKTDEWPSGKA